MYGASFTTKKATGANDIGLKYYLLACSKVIEEFENPSLQTIQVLVVLSCFSLCKNANNPDLHFRSLTF